MFLILSRFDSLGSTLLFISLECAKTVKWGVWGVRLLVRTFVLQYTDLHSISLKVNKLINSNQDW